MVQEVAGERGGDAAVFVSPGFVELYCVDYVFSRQPFSCLWFLWNGEFIVQQ